MLPGATASVSKYFLQSQEAAARANASMTAVTSSAHLREETEEKMNDTRREFENQHDRHAQRLDALAAELQTLDLSTLSRQVRVLTSRSRVLHVRCSRAPV